MSSIARRPHCLIGEKSLAMPRHVIFVDTETKAEELPNGQTKQNLILGWACYYRRGYGRHLERTEWFYFTKALSFWSFVYSHLRPKTKIWFIARNVVFDFTVLKGWNYLRRVGFRVKFFHNKGLTTVISVTSRYGSIVFLDSLNWFVESIEKTGERLGIPKLKIDFENCTIQELSNYCRRDVEIDVENFKQYIEFLENYGIARLRYTRGSTAMSAYLFGHYRNKIYIHNNKQAIDLERAAYKGGRTECFYLGELNSDTYYTLDVNSLYPSVMLNNLYPVKYLQIINNPEYRTLERELVDKSVIARVLIETDEPAYAVKHDRTIFPVGCFWTTLTTPELKYALSKGHIKEVKRVVVYEQADIFSSYVKRFYALRQKLRGEGQSEYEEFCKKLLNSLYGKWGQKAEVWKKIGETSNQQDRVEDCFSFGSNQRGSIRYLLGEIFELVGYKECFNSFPAIPAHVSAYGRMALYELMKKAGEGNYFYCDTDSLIVNTRGLCCLQSQIDNVSLGKLKLVSESVGITIRGLKDYSTTSKTVIKGIRKNAVEISDGVYEQEVWPSFRGLLRSGNANTYTIKKQQKTLTRKYSKGNVDKDGSVSPFLLDESYLLQPTFV